MLEHILDGGPIMIPLLGLSILGVAIIIDRIRVFRMAAVDTEAMRETIIKELEKGNIEEAIEACEKTRGPLAAIMMEGLLRFRKMLRMGKPIQEIRENVDTAMSEFAPHVIDALERRLNVLSTIAGVAPLLGMTGTVTGMIAAFATLAESGMDAGGVGQGIAEALVTTAAGLIIAIPALVAFRVFERRVERFILEIEELSTEFTDTIALEFEVIKP